jgi:hypothetical protein
MARRSPSASPRPPRSSRATHSGWIKPLFLPKPEAIWSAFEQSLSGDLDEHTLSTHFLASIARVFAAFALAVVLGVPAGLAMGVSRVARGVLDPPIEFYRPLPPLAYLPLMVIWFGIGETSKIILLFLAIFAPVALAAIGDPARDRPSRAAGHPGRPAHRHGSRVDDARRRRDGRRRRGSGEDGVQRRQFPAH